MRCKFVIGLILVSFWICNADILSGQEIEDNISYGQQAYDAGDYYNATVFWSEVVEKRPMDIDLAYKYAQANRLFNNYSIAEKWYEKVLQKDRGNKYPRAIFWLAEMNKCNGNYEDAWSNFRAYFNRFKDEEDYFTRKAHHEIRSANILKGILNDTLFFRIEHLDERINTPYSEFGGVQLKDSILFFSALRLVVKDPYETLLSSVYLSHLYQSNISVAGYGRGKMIESKIFNSKKENTANIALSNDFKKIFFTVCSAQDNASLHCRLMCVEFLNGKWTDPKALDILNSNRYTSTHPSYAKFDDREVLFFVSDRPGGLGGFDIWYSPIDGEKYGEPVNLGSIINTPGNEITPYYFDKEGFLYFSSDWHTGLGGYDVFRTEGFFNEWKVPENMGVPINSTSNDIYFSRNSYGYEGYLTSNRPGSFFIKGETCCNDIFYWEKTDKEKPEEEITDTANTIDEQIQDLLPLTLYFHNDIPDPGSKDTLTEMNYKQTLVEYYDLRDTYISEYSKGLKGDERKQAIQDIQEFFDDYVGKGFRKLQLFADLLAKDLSAGKVVEMRIKGYTSPLNTAEYNQRLAKRRISSLINFLKEYDDGFFMPYLNAQVENDAFLIINEDPIGEKEVPDFVSDNPNDLKNSVYSRSAAMERRIQIIYYSSESSSPHDKDTVYLTEVIIDQPHHDFGTLPLNAKVVHEFEILNTGDNDLIIRDIQISCGCTIADYSKVAVEPGDTAKIRISFESFGEAGYHSENIILQINTQESYLVLEVSAFFQ